MPDNTAAIARIDALLASGVKSTQTDGLAVTYRTRAELISERARLAAENSIDPVARSKVATVRMSGPNA